MLIAPHLTRRSALRETPEFDPTPLLSKELNDGGVVHIPPSLPEILDALGADIARRIGFSLDALQALEAGLHPKLRTFLAAANDRRYCLHPRRAGLSVGGAAE